MRNGGPMLRERRGVSIQLGKNCCAILFFWHGLEKDFSTGRCNKRFQIQFTSEKKKDQSLREKSYTYLSRERDKIYIYLSIFSEK